MRLVKIRTIKPEFPQSESIGKLSRYFPCYISREFAPQTGLLTTGVFSNIAPLWFTSAKHGFRAIDLAECCAIYGG
jgi:hypothetical protein